jgi:Spy/CpxP family protein refolding chaperone
MNRLSKLKIAGYLLAIFLAGGVTGALLMGVVVKHIVSTQMKPEKMADRWCRELESSLKLTPEQFQKIRPIVNDTLDQVRSIMTEQLSTTISNGNARIAAELTPEQKLKFEQMVKEREEMMRRSLGKKTDDAPKKM